MSDAHRLDQLESTIAHQGRSIEELSDMVREQWLAIDRLQKAVRQMLDRAEASGDGAAPEVTKPPHY
ncbi:protein SlyX [Aureimonas sp. SA4125]|uniref:SlyX family protein n=1 Tax=Aureimonas sp. SA4125 TaxID=2826993 RepID=UPI001CC650DC|nr:SlyX family protein [Aureimonas sp. SA4125]BDA82632.1 protein SlyX [Aureimonas sp. SA4125]